MEKKLPLLVVLLLLLATIAVVVVLMLSRGDSAEFKPVVRTPSGYGSSGDSAGRTSLSEEVSTSPVTQESQRTESGTIRELADTATAEVIAQRLLVVDAQTLELIPKSHFLVKHGDIDERTVRLESDGLGILTLPGNMRTSNPVILYDGFAVAARGGRHTASAKRETRVSLVQAQAVDSVWSVDRGLQFEIPLIAPPRPRGRGGWYISLVKAPNELTACIPDTSTLFVENSTQRTAWFCAGQANTDPNGKQSLRFRLPTSIEGQLVSKHDYLEVCDQLQLHWAIATLSTGSVPLVSASDVAIQPLADIALQVVSADGVPRADRVEIIAQSIVSHVSPLKATVALLDHAFQTKFKCIAGVTYKVSSYRGNTPTGNVSYVADQPSVLHGPQGITLVETPSLDGNVRSNIRLTFGSTSNLYRDYTVATVRSVCVDKKRISESSQQVAWDAQDGQPIVGKLEVERPCHDKDWTSISVYSQDLLEWVPASITVGAESTAGASIDFVCLDNNQRETAEYTLRCVDADLTTLEGEYTVAIVEDHAQVRTASGVGSHVSVYCQRDQLKYVVIRRNGFMDKRIDGLSLRQRSEGENVVTMQVGWSRQVVARQCEVAELTDQFRWDAVGKPLTNCSLCVDGLIVGTTDSAGVCELIASQEPSAIVTCCRLALQSTEKADRRELVIDNGAALVIVAVEWD